MQGWVSGVETGGALSNAQRLSIAICMIVVGVITVSFFMFWGEQNDNDDLIKQPGFSDETVPFEEFYGTDP